MSLVTHADLTAIALSLRVAALATAAELPLALAAAFALKFAKLILFGLAAVGAVVMKLFRRKPPSNSAAA